MSITSIPVLERPWAPEAPDAPEPDRHHAGPQPHRRPAPRPRPARTARTSSRQLLVTLVVLPLTVLPFLAYVTLTPEGRLVRDRVLVALAPPELPRLTAHQRAAVAAMAPRYHGPVMALAYHGIGSASDGEGGFVVSAARFGEHLATLKAAGMHAVTAAQVAAAFTGGKRLPPNAVMISFDDGRSDAMMFADPLLKEAGMAATMFVIADAASKAGVYYASWDEIESYARSGRWDIQSHTAGSHREQKVAGGDSLPMLTSLAPGETVADYRARVREDLADAAAAVESHVGRRPVAFAYPFGAYGGDRSNDVAIEAVLRQEVTRQYAIAFQQDDQETVPLMTADDDRLLLRRLEVGNWSGLELLERIGRARQATPGLAAPPAATPEVAPPSAAGPPAAPPAAVDLSAPAATGPGRSAAASTGTPATGTASAPVPAPSLSQASVPSGVDVATPTTVGTVPPSTSPPVTAPPPTTPTTRPPTTSPPTTRPPSTSPPTTACKPAGNSGKCAPGQS